MPQTWLKSVSPNKLGICKKESKETKHWMRMIAKAQPELAVKARVFWKEADELQRIFIAVINKSRNNASSKR